MQAKNTERKRDSSKAMAPKAARPSLLGRSAQARALSRVTRWSAEICDENESNSSSQVVPEHIGQRSGAIRRLAS
jgi:hypothetical protein